MKGFLILNNAFISVFSTGVSCYIFDHHYSQLRHNEEIKRVQKIMAINHEIYGVHILEEDEVLYRVMAHTLTFSDKDQPPVVEEIEVKGDLEKMKSEFIKNKIFGSNKTGMNIIDSSDLPEELMNAFKKFIDERMNKENFKKSPDSPKNA